MAWTAERSFRDGTIWMTIVFPVAMVWETFNTPMIKATMKFIDRFGSFVIAINKQSLALWDHLLLSPVADMA